MFPANLHKNIVQLDREISFLENEYKNMDIDKRKSNTNLGQNLYKCGKMSNILLKSPPVKEKNKKGTDAIKRIKKLSPPLSSRMYSSSSLMSNCSKKSTRVSNASVRSKLCKQNQTKSSDHSCKLGENGNYQYTHVRQNQNERKNFVNNNSHTEFKKKDPNIQENCVNNIMYNDKSDFVNKEVVFSNPGSQIEVTVRPKPTIQEQVTHCSETCHLQNKNNNGQKWSEILSHDYDAQKEITENFSTINGACGNEVHKKLVKEIETQVKKIFTNSSKSLIEGNMAEISNSTLNTKNYIYQTIQKLCDHLIAEKEYLSKEINKKNSAIAILRKREEEYLSLISILKVNLEKTKENASSRLSSIKELSSLKQKLLEQVKLSETLKKSQIQMKEMIDKYAIENDRLKTEIKIYKLESQKHNVLMAGKDAEINRYKEEVGNFRKQISEHLMSLKSNAQAIDLKKIMETIIQHSQIFSQDDMDSVTFEQNVRDLSKPNGLMHSSPTSTKTSVVNSSWKQISSIREHEPFINLNESSEMNFIQVYGDNILDNELSNDDFKKTVKKLSRQNNEKPHSFTNCLSTDNKIITNPTNSNSNNYNCERLIESNSKKIPNDANELLKEHSTQKFKCNIEELLKSMKLKWSEGICKMTSDTAFNEEWLNNSD